MTKINSDKINPTVADALKYYSGMCFTCDLSERTLRAIAMNELAIAALTEQAARINPKPLSVERFEQICEAVHNGWWEEKKRQGCTDHPDVIPYSELSEAVKDYDRVTVRRVLDALGIAYEKEGTCT